MQIGPATDALSLKVESEMLENFNKQMDCFLKSKTQQLNFKQQIIDKQYQNMDKMRHTILEQKKTIARFQLNQNWNTPMDSERHS